MTRGLGDRPLGGRELIGRGIDGGGSRASLGGASSPEARLIASLKAAGIFTRLDGLVVATSAGNKLTNLINPAKPATAVNSPSFAAPYGYTGNGTSSRILLPFIPSVDGVNYTLNRAGFGVVSGTDAASNTSDVGTQASANISNIVTRGGSNFITGDINSTANVVILNPESLGMFSLCRSDSATVKAYRGSTQIGANQAVAATGLPATAFWGLGSNSGAFSTKTQCLWWWGDSLHDIMPQFWAAIQTFLNSYKVFPFALDYFGDSFTFNAAFLGDLPTVANFYPALTSTALTSLGSRIATVNFAVSGTNSGNTGNNLQAKITATRTPPNPGLAGIYIGQNDVGGGFSSAQSQANIVAAGQALQARGYQLLLIYGKHYDNLTSGADTVSAQLAGNLTMRTYQQAAATQLAATGSVIYVDLYAYMRALIVAGTYTQGDHLWHEGATDTHPNAIGEQIIADATVAALVAAGWSARLV